MRHVVFAQEQGCSVAQNTDRIDTNRILERDEVVTCGPLCLLESNANLNAAIAY